MSPPTAHRAPGEAPWEITESECIDFSVENTGGSPDEELRRKCNNLILLQHPHMHPFQPGHLASHPDNCQVKDTDKNLLLLKHVVGYWAGYTTNCLHQGWTWPTLSECHQL